MHNPIRVFIILLGLVCSVAFVNSQIKTMSKINDEGEMVLLQLRPVDPRAFMMGDYMTLDYAAGTLPVRDEEGPPSGQAIVSLDENNVATFVGLDKGELSTSEIRINYARDFRGRATYGGSRYYFQEGTAELYEAAEYGVFKVAPSGRALLVGLADENFDLITPDRVTLSPTP